MHSIRYATLDVHDICKVDLNIVWAWAMTGMCYPIGSTISQIVDALGFKRTLMPILYIYT
eukprot:scaffold22839_cov171-Amphora_coffeaeformis.AAC.13